MQTFLRRILLLLVVTCASHAGDYSITVNSVGIGNNWRAGDVTPIHITIHSNVAKPISAWVQWEVPDADGDTVLWGRAITTAPMSDTSVWLYAPTREWDNSDTVWTIRLREFVDNKPSGELERIRFSPKRVGAIRVSDRVGHIAIFGTRRLGLANYLPTSTNVKHESAMLVSGLTTADLPDAWPSYASLEALVWADAPPVFSIRQTEAIEEWVARGGHFVMTLPNIGDPWALGTQNAPLKSLTSGLQPKRVQLPLSTLKNILGRGNDWKQMLIAVQVFGNIRDQWDQNVTPLLWLENGTVLAVQRRYGFGTVTTIGIDLASGQLASLGLPETDVFWNRIFGKRTDTPSAVSLNNMREANTLSNTMSKVAILQAGKMIAQKIAMTAKASGKLGTAFLLVVAYWLIGGPLGYYILRLRKKLQWTWLLFAGTACLFTFGTWVLAMSTSGITTPLKHVSVIDHIFGGTGQKVTGWFSVFLPQFGNTNVSLHGNTSNLLLPWTPPDASMTPDFIDNREVFVNLDQVPHSFNQPSRATTANFAYNWTGGIEHHFYKTLIRVNPENKPRVRKTQLSGAITNNASTALNEVSIIWVTGTPSSSRLSGGVLNNMYAWRIPTLNPGESIDFSTLRAENISSFTNAVNGRYQIEDKFGQGANSADWRRKLEMLSLYSHLTPPVYIKNAQAKNGPASHHAIRTGGRALDLTTWFSRPCVIVLGFFPESPIPVTISTDGVEIIKSEGSTLLRWVYPLEQTP